LGGVQIPFSPKSKKIIIEFNHGSILSVLLLGVSMNRIKEYFQGSSRGGHPRSTSNFKVLGSIRTPPYINLTIQMWNFKVFHGLPVGLKSPNVIQISLYLHKSRPRTPPRGPPSGINPP